jgi:hypothetical protein
MEMLLLALGACTATHLVIILEKKRKKLESLEVVCSRDRAAEPPTVWTKLEIVFRLRGLLDEAAVQHAVDLSREKILLRCCDAPKNGGNRLALRAPAFGDFFGSVGPNTRSIGSNSSTMMRMAIPVTRPTISTSPGYRTSASGARNPDAG